MTVIPIVKGTEYTLVDINGKTIKVRDWVNTKDKYSVIEEAASAIAPLGEGAIKYLLQYQETLKKVIEEVGKKQAPLPYSELVDGCGSIVDKEYKAFVEDWIGGHIWEAKLDTQRPEYEIECWRLIPLPWFSAEEYEFTDEDGDSNTYWLVEDKEGQPINPNKVSHEYWYTDEVIDEGVTYHVFDDEEDAQRCVDYLNIELQGVEEFGYPESGWEFSYPLTVEILQEQDIAVYEYNGPEGSMELADLTGYSSGLERKLSQLCAYMCQRGGHLVNTKLGPRYVDIIN